MTALDQLRAFLNCTPAALEADAYLEEMQATATRTQLPTHLYLKPGLAVITTEDPGKRTPKVTIQPKPRRAR